MESSGGFHIQGSVAASQKFVPAEVRFIKKVISQQTIAHSADQGLVKVTITDQSQADLPSDAPRPTCYVTSPELVQEALAAPLLGDLDTSKCLVVGLSNNGVTCYVNACIQMLYSSVHAMKLFTSEQYRRLLIRDQLSRAIFTTLDSFRAATRNRSSGILVPNNDIYPTALIQQLPHFKMSPYLMGDAYELLLLILDHISLEEIRVAKATDYIFPNRDTTAIDQIFGQLQQTTIFCESCRKSTVRYSLTRSLQLPYTSTLYGSLKKYFKSSKVDDYFCDNCKQRTEISISQAIRNIPNVALFVISRWDKQGCKKTSPCACPLKLDMSRGLSRDVVAPLVVKYEKKQSKNHEKRGALSDILTGSFNPLTTPKMVTHQLAAVINHHGSTMDSGHYTAFVRDLASGAWYLANDSTITHASEADVMAGKDAYVLMYERVGITVKESNSGISCEKIVSEELHNNESFVITTPTTQVQQTGEARPRIPGISTDSSVLKDMLYQENPETWDGESLPAEILAAKAPNGALSLISDYLHREPDEMDADIDRSRKRKNKAMREENYQKHMMAAQMKRNQRTLKWIKRRRKLQKHSTGKVRRNKA